MPRTIIVTGAAGVLGRPVVSTLASQSADVVAVDVAGKIGAFGQTASLGGSTEAPEGAVSPTATCLRLGAAHPNPSRTYPATARHSASAAERLSL